VDVKENRFETNCFRFFCTRYIQIRCLNKNCLIHRFSIQIVLMNGNVSC